MRDRRTSTIHPLATSDYDEGTTEGQRKVFDDLNVRHLQLEKEEVAKLLEILGGDQSSVIFENEIVVVVGTHGFRTKKYHLVPPGSSISPKVTSRELQFSKSYCFRIDG